MLAFALLPRAAGERGCRSIGGKRKIDMVKGRVKRRVKGRVKRKNRKGEREVESWN